MASYKNRILNNIVQRKLINRPIKNILNLTNEKMNFPGIYTENYFEKNMGNLLPFPKHSFDFVYISNPLKIFSSPSHMYAELIRIGKSGIISNQSPLNILLNAQMNIEYVTK